MTQMFRLILSIILFTNLISAQTLLVSSPLELKKSSDFHQTLNAVNQKTNDIYAFAADKEKIHLLHYNTALFLRDTISINQPAKQYPSILGYAFEDNNPFLFTVSDDLQKIQQIGFDVKNKSISVKTSDFIPVNENFICSFTQNNIFYAITAPQKAENLKLYIFKNGSSLQQTIDFSGFKLSDEKAQVISFTDVLKKFPIEKLETQSVNPLVAGIRKTKLFVEPERIILTVDTNPNVTYLFKISLNDFSITKNDIPQLSVNPLNPELPEYANSYYHSGRLYQLKFNEEKLIVSSRDIQNPDTPITYEATVNDAITFRNSPLWNQTGNRQPSEISNVKKFFRKLTSSEAGMTVYTTTNKTVLVTIGGLREITTTGNVILGVALGAGSIAAGGGTDVIGLFDNDTAQSVYFESVFDEQSRHLDSEPEILADDYIAQFLNENDDATLQNVFRYKDFYILAYYDKKAKQYVLRKFMDGGVD
jgi:hypothetical protein